MQKAPAKADAQETWKAIGKATWVEGPTDIYSDSFKGLRSVLDIEESETTPGRYRLKPYGSQSAISDLFFGMFDCENYFYINAQDPDSVYCEDFTNDAIQVIVSQLVPQNGWQGVAIYGTVKDKVITFPANSFGYTGDINKPNEEKKWVYSNTDGEFTVFLPGAVVTDYSFQADVESCAVDGAITIGCASGADIAKVCVKAVEGTVTPKDADYADALANGQSIATKGESKWTAPKAGKYTLMVVAADAKGEIKSQDYYAVYSIDEDSDNWTAIGQCDYTDVFLTAIGYTNSLLAEPQTYKVDVERNKTNPSLVRIVDPYVNHPYFQKKSTKLKLSSHGHHHYIYLDYSDPDFVMIPESPMGADLGYGMVCANSPASWYYPEHSKEEIRKYYGVATYKDGTITLPNNALFTSETRSEHNALYRNAFEGKLVLTSAGVDGIEADGTEAPAEYYNLQGIRVANPQAGQLLIRRQGKKATKVVIR